jgi:hypothetical protein
MALHTVIADVGTTLIELLCREMQDFFKQAVDYGEEEDKELKREIVLGSPADIEDEMTRLSLFLYRIEENGYLRNQEMQQLSPTELKYRPLTLDLFYMMTAYSPQKDPTEKNISEHRTLGRAMQVFYDNAILRGSVLKGSLAGTGAELRIMLTTLTAEDINIAQMWNSFENKPYKPSVFYKVTPVSIDSTRETDAHRVVEKDTRYHQIISRSISK